MNRRDFLTVAGAAAAAVAAPSVQAFQPPPADGGQGPLPRRPGRLFVPEGAGREGDEVRGSHPHRRRGGSGRHRPDVVLAAGRQPRRVPAVAPQARLEEPRRDLQRRHPHPARAGHAGGSRTAARRDAQMGRTSRRSSVRRTSACSPASSRPAPRTNRSSATRRRRSRRRRTSPARRASSSASKTTAASPCTRKETIEIVKRANHP